MNVQIMSHSDHALLSVSLAESHSSLGPGLWRLDTALLERQDFVNGILKFLADWKPPEELTNPVSIWEWLKFEIQSYSIKFSKGLHSDMKQLISDLNKRLNVLYEEMDSKEKITLRK